MKGAFLDRATVDAGDLDLSPLAAVLPGHLSFDITPRETLIERLADCTVAITNKVPFDAAAFAALPQLRLVCVAATGVNHIDLDAARTRGVAVCNVRDYATASVTQHVWALILALTTRLGDCARDIAAGKWQESPHFSLLSHPVRELAGRTLGIVGYGVLGRAVAAVAPCFGMQVLVAARRDESPPAGRMAFDTILREADVLSLHCPLTPETRGLIGACELAAMKPDALLINAARGALVDEAALAAALREGRLGGAGIDVLAEEPPRHGNPLLEPGIPNLIVTPHTAWAAREARQRCIDEIAANIAAFQQGVARNRVG